MTKPVQDQALFRYADDLGGLELLEANYHQQRFSRHVHEGFCIGVIDKGAQRFYREGSQHIAPEGSIILVNSDQVHDGHRATEFGWAYRTIYPTEAMLSDVLCGLKGPRSGLPWFVDPVVYDPAMAAKLRFLFDLIRHSHNPLERQSHYLAVMSELIQRHGGNRSRLEHLRAHPLAVQRVRDYLDTHCCETVSLEQLAHLVQLTPHYLVRLFQRTIGVPPHAYQLMRRLQRAKILIRGGLSLADTAIDAGFTDQSHLHRHFKRMMGVTPGQYRSAIH